MNHDQNFQEMQGGPGAFDPGYINEQVACVPYFLNNMEGKLMDRGMSWAMLMIQPFWDGGPRDVVDR